ncbi:hypothetical protein [Ruminococcus sp.]|uniref:hypothetical protein n=1 Tax=Ruminococcus sp. TaxID=41978 RepID=UPI002E76A0AE|nr:hypothetical protein [Ruminococcus sp.]MEE1262847.1 hypothetical protein [Ruminococcus sp.]
MTTNIFINNANRTITLTSKKFAAAASRYGTEAYKKLQEARKDYPDYQVVIKSSHKAKADKMPRLPYTFMEEYIKAHDDDNSSIMAEFNNLRGTSEEAKTLGVNSMPYNEIKDWFFQQFPAFADFQKKREAVLKAVAEKKAAAKKAAA